jgi:hypothetical protein
MKTNRAIIILSMVALGIYFVFSVHDGLRAYFTMDDGGNLLKMHSYWGTSLGHMIVSALLVVTPTYRPLGGIYYFVLYKLAGFNPMPYHAVCLLLLGVNLYLAFSVLRQLTDSLAAALLGTVLIANHPALLFLIYNSGTVYELLCFFFYFLALRCYFIWRKADQAAGRTVLAWKRLAIILVLTGCALDSKEMAMTLPAALLLMEFVYFTPISWAVRDIRKFALHQGRAVLVTAALVLPTIAVKTLIPNPLTYDPAYGGHTLRGAIDHLRAYQSFLIYGNLYYDITLSTVALIALWIGMAVAALLLRSRPMKFGLCFYLVSMVPIVLITRRNAYMLYIPLLGWALYSGALFQRVCDGIIRMARLRPRFAGTVRFACVAAAAVWVANLHAERLAGPSLGIHLDHDAMRRVMNSLRKAHPHLPRGASLLILDDPLPPGWELPFLADMAYNDPTLRLDRVKMLPELPTKEDLIHYTYIMGGGWNLHDVSGDSDTVPLVEVRFSPRAVKPHETYTVEIPSLAGQSVDIAADAIAGGRADRVIIKDWCTLDTAGKAVLETPDLPSETITVRWIRPHNGGWTPASGELKIE